LFAVVANGYSGVCRSIRQLELVKAIYPYPKFVRVDTEQEAMSWLSRQSRGRWKNTISNYGNTAKTGFAVVEYFISDNNIYYNVYTDRLGFIKIAGQDDVLVDARRNLLKIVISNVVLNDVKITSHVIAVMRLFQLLGEYIDVNLIVPDVSVYLALTRYRGKSHVIKRCRDLIASRLGAVAMTIRE
jgi:hypothetical protein